MYKRKEIIGDCTLYLGDCLEVMPLLGEVDSVVCDPPFGMNYKNNMNITRTAPIKNDDSLLLFDYVTSIEPLHSSYIFGRWDNLINIKKKPKSVITWDKVKHSMGDLKHEHGRTTELIFFYNGVNHFFPLARPNDTIKCLRTENTKHPNQKPAQLMQAIIEWTAGVVLDACMGSGTTLVACAKMNRKGIGIELDEGYFDIACKRVEDAYRQPDMFYGGLK